MNKYIDVEKLIAEIRRIVEEETPISKGSDYYHGVADTADKLLSSIASLQQEQVSTEREIAEAYHYAEMIRERDNARIQQEHPEKSQKDCNGCPHCVDRKDQYGWNFKGCFGGPYQGKFIAEIDEGPLKQEQPEVDLEKEIEMYISSKGLLDYAFLIPSIARHFAEWGATHLRK